MMFKDRSDAGKKLAELLLEYSSEETVVFALPRGGVAVAAEIAKAIDAPLDIIITKKIGHPSNPEYAVCALAEDGGPICNQSELERLGNQWLEDEKKKARDEILRRRKEYLGDTSRINVENKIAIIVDDGIATGLTMIASIEEMKRHNPKEIVVAIPVVPHLTALRLEGMVDRLVSIESTSNFLGALSAYYDDFTQVGDDEVKNILKEFY
ncbi:MAG: phosphoribosyltransferase family protein [Gudongella sp.]|jgi:predicted phosphoribosyltransferase|nr:phosphoribosyltransferase family protein [Gudongella sp.]